jgi:beta-mannosidase
MRLIVFFSLFVSLCAALKRWDLTGSNNNSFTVGNCDGKIKGVAGTVPGLITTDLINAGIIKLDPYFRYEELNLGWVPQNCWQYESDVFELSNVESSSNLYLRFDGLDSVASIFINDVLVGKSVNALRSHTFLIDSALIMNSKKNVLKVQLDDPLAYMKAEASKYPYSVPETQNYNVWVEPSHRNFLRKAGSDMGWDWGPAFAPSGIAGEVYFFQEPKNVGKLDGVSVQQTFNSNMSSVLLEVRVQITSIPLDIDEQSVPIQVFLNSQRYISTTVTIGTNEREAILVGSIVVDNPDLWWPVGSGTQFLYSLEVRYGGGSSRQSLIRKIGLREVELVQDPMEADSAADVTVDGKAGLYVVPPASFYFRINRLPVFIRGANFIPIDVFESRVTPADREFIVRAAVASNMNMLRVWGGGRYQPDDFYALCDELGVLVWQEVMLACALYPSDKAFLTEITLEVTEQAFRLGTHASIVVWGGNNENEVALGWFSESLLNRDLYVADYSALYGGTVYPALVAVIGSSGAMAAWVDSSPSNGLLSTDPYAKRWGLASTAAAGDVHFYNYACDCEDFNSYPQARFVSEFGFQTMPSFLAYKPVSSPTDWAPDSDLMLHRQRHEDGNSQIQSQLAQHFALPSVCADSDSRSFDMYLYLVGLQQSRCYETAVNRWRQLRSQAAHTMGILYWQLNDIWQGPSWASIEWGGRWKPLQYAMKRAYAPVVVTVSAVSSGVAVSSPSPIEIHAVNDLLHSAVSVTVTVHLVSWTDSQSSSVLWSGTQSVSAGSSRLLWTGDVDSALAQSGCAQDTCYVRTTSTSSRTDSTGISVTTALYPAFSFLTYMKDAKLSAQSSVTLSGFRQVSPLEVEFDVSVNATSPFLFLELVDEASVLDGVEPAPSAAAAAKTVEGGVFAHNAGWFSDNNFVAEAGSVYRIRYMAHRIAVSAAAVQRRLQARVLQHAYDCKANSSNQL